MHKADKTLIAELVASSSVRSVTSGGVAGELLAIGTFAIHFFVTCWSLELSRHCHAILVGATVHASMLCLPNGPDPLIDLAKSGNVLSFCWRVDILAVGTAHSDVNDFLVQC